ncbi:MAG TPA: hypothetical protein VIH64_16690 [Streptosporangiaceae bacterium]
MTPTWNPERLARAVAAATGVHLVVEGPCPGGQIGAAYVRWPDGHLAVLSWGPGVPLAQARRGPFAVADALRADGYPAPATELAADTRDGLAVVQELLPGAPPQHVDEELLAQALELNGRHASALATRADVPAYPLYLRQDGPGYCCTDPCARSARRRRRWNAGSRPSATTTRTTWPGLTPCTATSTTRTC